MSHRRVVISVDPPTGDITYAPSALHVSHRDKVIWETSPENPFTIVFPQTPFEDGRVSLRSPGPPLESPPFAPNALGVYHYMVAVSVSVSVEGKKRPEIFLDAGCPDIVVGK